MIEACRTWFACFLLIFFLAACTSDEEMDYCKNHYRFHDKHDNAPGQLIIELTEQGDLQVVLTLPVELLESQLQGVSSGLQPATLGLGDPARVYDLHSEQPCELADSSVIRKDTLVEIHYQARCGANNKLGQIDIKLFDLMPGLDEMEVSITTPATAKHFAISRQCERAIFRLK